MATHCGRSAASVQGLLPPIFLVLAHHLPLHAGHQSGLRLLTGRCLGSPRAGVWYCPPPHPWAESGCQRSRPRTAPQRAKQSRKKHREDQGQETMTRTQAGARAAARRARDRPVAYQPPKPGFPPWPRCHPSPAPPFMIDYRRVAGPWKMAIRGDS